MHTGAGGEGPSACLPCGPCTVVGGWVSWASAQAGLGPSLGPLPSCLLLLIALAAPPAWGPRHSRVWKWAGWRAHVRTGRQARVGEAHAPPAVQPLLKTPSQMHSFELSFVLESPDPTFLGSLGGATPLWLITTEAQEQDEQRGTCRGVGTLRLPQGSCPCGFL